MASEARRVPPAVSREEVFHRVADVLGCKWTLAILEALARGVNRPGRIEKDLTGLSKKVLYERLKKLERYDLVVRHSYPEIPPRVEYDFTEQGRQMLDVVRRVRVLADEWHSSP